MRIVLAVFPFILLITLSVASLFYVPHPQSDCIQDLSPSLGENRLSIYPTPNQVELSLLSHPRFSPASAGKARKASIEPLSYSRPTASSIDFRILRIADPTVHIALILQSDLPLDSVKLNDALRLKSRRLEKARRWYLRSEDVAGDTLYLPKQLDSDVAVIEIGSKHQFASLHIPAANQANESFILTDRLANNSTLLMPGATGPSPIWQNSTSDSYVYFINAKSTANSFRSRRTGKSTMNIFLPFGTDHEGRDVLGVFLLGSRTALYILLLIAVITMPLGVSLGMYAGYQSNRFSQLIQFGMNVFSILPRIIIIAFISRVTNDNLWIVLLALAFCSWPESARAVMNQSRILRSQEYIVAAVTLGASVPRLILRHFLPNLKRLILVLLLETATTAIIIESTMTFLNLVTHTEPRSWGYLLRVAKGLDKVTHHTLNEWQIIVPISALVLLITVSAMALRQIRMDER